EDQAAVVDLEGVAVECAHGRACDAVALGVVLAAVAGAAVTGGEDGFEVDPAVLGVLGDARVAGELLAGRTIRLDRTAEVSAAVRDDREARALVSLVIRDGAVVADEGGPPGDLSLDGIDDERRDVPVVGRERRERAE